MGCWINGLVGCGYWGDGWINPMMRSVPVVNLLVIRVAETGSNNEHELM